MTIDVADPRFLLPRVPSSVAVIDVPSWTDALGELGVTVTEGAELVVCSPATLSDGMASGARYVVVEGATRAARAQLEKHGYRARTWMALGDERTEALVPLDGATIGRYAIGRWRPPASKLRRVVGQAAVTAGVQLPGRRHVAVASRVDGAPAPVAAARAAGVSRASAMFLGVPGLELTSRLAALVFDDGGEEPVAVVKFLRSRDVVSTAFDDDQRALSLAAQHPVVAAHAPRVLGRVDVDGHAASVESAAVGTSIGRALTSGSARARTSVDAVASWLVDVGASTADGTPDAAIDALVRDVLPAYGLDASLADVARDVPGVFAHRDLGTWNVVSDGERFTVLDWEAATASDLPLSDLTYFLGDALALAAGARTIDERAQAMVDLFAGRAPGSEVLFAWVSRAANAMSLDPDIVRRLVPLSWLAHGLPPAGPDGRRRAPTYPAELLAQRWLHDPLLGLDWKAFR